MNKLSLVVLLVGSLALAIALNTNTATSPAPQPRVVAVAAATTASPAPQVVVAGQGQGTGHDEGYTCTSASSCAVLAAALTGNDPGGCFTWKDCNKQHRQPRAHTSRAPRSSTAQHEDQPGWNCATQGNHVCGTGVAGGPLADDSCPAGGVWVYGTPHGCRYR